MNEAKLLKQGQSYYEYPTVDSLKTLDFWVWRAKQTRRFIVVLRHLLHTVCPPSPMSFHDCHDCHDDSATIPFGGHADLFLP